MTEQSLDDRHALAAARARRQYETTAADLFRALYLAELQREGIAPPHCLPLEIARHDVARAVWGRL